MLDAMISGGFGLAGGLIEHASANRRFKKMMQHLRMVEAWQRQNIATAQNNIQGSRQAFQSDPRRLETRNRWQQLLDAPSAYTPEFVSSQKQTALSTAARNTAESSRRIASDAQRHGLGNSPYAAALQGDLYAQGNRDYLNTSAAIDTNAATHRKADQERVLGGYTDYLNQDQDREYQFSRDLSSMLGSISYGSSLGMTG